MVSLFLCLSLLIKNSFMGILGPTLKHLAVSLKASLSFFPHVEALILLTPAIDSKSTTFRCGAPEMQSFTFSHLLCAQIVHLVKASIWETSKSCSSDTPTEEMSEPERGGQCGIHFTALTANEGWHFVSLWNIYLRRVTRPGSSFKFASSPIPKWQKIASTWVKVVSYLFSF